MSFSESYYSNANPPNNMAAFVIESLKTRHRLDEAVEEAKALRENISEVNHNYELREKDLQIVCLKNHLNAALKQVLAALKMVKQKWESCALEIDSYIKSPNDFKNVSGKVDDIINWETLIQSFMTSKLGKDVLAANKVRAKVEHMMDAMTFKMSDHGLSIKEASEKLLNSAGKVMGSISSYPNDASIFDLKLPTIDDLSTPPASQSKRSESEQFSIKLSSNPDRPNSRASMQLRKESQMNIREQTPLPENYEVETLMRSPIVVSPSMNFHEALQESPLISQEKRDKIPGKLDLLKNEIREQEESRKTSSSQEALNCGNKRSHAQNQPIMDLESFQDADSVFMDTTDEIQSFRSNQHHKVQDISEENEPNRLSFLTQNPFSTNLRNFIDFL